MKPMLWFGWVVVDPKGEVYPQVVSTKLAAQTQLVMHYGEHVRTHTHNALETLEVAKRKGWRVYHVVVQRCSAKT